MKKVKISMAVVAMIVAISAAFAFKAPAKNEVKPPTRYHYTSSSAALVDMQNIANWVAEEPGCGTSGTKPCALDFTGNLSQLDIYLDSFDDPADITTEAVERKN